MKRSFSLVNGVILAMNSLKTNGKLLFNFATLVSPPRLEWRDHSKISSHTILKSQSHWHLLGIDIDIHKNVSKVGMFSIFACTASRQRSLSSPTSQHTNSSHKVSSLRRRVTSSSAWIYQLARRSLLDLQPMQSSGEDLWISEKQYLARVEVAASYTAFHRS
jgi:hypothetical protein